MPLPKVESVTQGEGNKMGGINLNRTTRSQIQNKTKGPKSGMIRPKFQPLDFVGLGLFGAPLGPVADMTTGVNASCIPYPL